MSAQDIDIIGQLTDLTLRFSGDTVMLRFRGDTTASRSYRSADAAITSLHLNLSRRMEDMTNPVQFKEVEREAIAAAKRNSCSLDIRAATGARNGHAYYCDLRAPLHPGHKHIATVHCDGRIEYIRE